MDRDLTSDSRQRASEEAEVRQIPHRDDSRPGRHSRARRALLGDRPGTIHPRISGHFLSRESRQIWRRCTTSAGSEPSPLLISKSTDTRARRVMPRTDLDALKNQGLLQIKTVRASARRAPIHCCRPHQTRPRGLPTELGFYPGQTIYKGFVKPRRCRTTLPSTGCFRRSESASNAQGGVIRRVVLDYELKQRIYTPLATFRSQSPKRSKADYARLQQEVAQQQRSESNRRQDSAPRSADRVRDRRWRDGARRSRACDASLPRWRHGRQSAGRVPASTPQTARRASSARVLEERDITVAILSL